MVEMAFESDVANSAHCMNVLVKQVGLLETERFIAHLSCERTDYTKWRQNQFEDLTLEERVTRLEKRVAMLEAYDGAVG